MLGGAEELGVGRKDGDFVFFSSGGPFMGLSKSDDIIRRDASHWTCVSRECARLPKRNLVAFGLFFHPTTSPACGHSVCAVSGSPFSSSSCSL